MTDALTGSVAPEAKDSLALKLGTVALGLVTARLASLLVSKVWHKATGNKAPKNADDEALSAIEAIVFATVTAALTVAAKRAARPAAVAAASKMAARKANKA